MLLRVQALVGDVQRLTSVLGLLGQQHCAEGAADLEPDAPFRKRRARLVDEQLGFAFADSDDQAEFVAAEPVCAPFGRGHGGELRAEAGE